MRSDSGNEKRNLGVFFYTKKEDECCIMKTKEESKKIEI
jgi:hypothetical protein